MLLTIEDVKKMGPNTDVMAPTIKAVVLDVSKVERETASTKSKFFAILADQTGSISCTIYNEIHYSKFIKGFAVVLINVLLKQSYIAITAKSEVAISQPFSIPEDIVKSAPALPGYQPKLLATAMDSPEKSIVTVKGKITKIFPSTSKAVKGDNIPFQELIIKDTSTKTKVAVWDSMVDKFEKNQLVKITNCRVRLYNDEKKLSTTVTSSSEVFPSDPDLDNVSSDEDVKDDEPPTTEMQIGLLSALFDVDPYLACPKGGCNNTKLVTFKDQGREHYYMTCSNCNGRYQGSTANTYLRITALLETDGSNKKVLCLRHK